MLATKYNSSGNHQWSYIYNGPGNGDDKANDIAISSSGNVYIAGESVGAGTNKDFITIKLNSAGTPSLYRLQHSGFFDSNPLYHWNCTL